MQIRDLKVVPIFRDYRLHCYKKSTKPKYERVTNYIISEATAVAFDIYIIINPVNIQFQFLATYIYN